MIGKSDYDNTPPLLFRLQEEILYVNSTESQPVMRRQSQLHFYVINISEEELLLSGKSGFAIELNITKGKGSSNMFAPHDDAGWGAIGSTDYFDVSGWMSHPLKKNSLRCTLKLKSDKNVVLKPGIGIDFTWKHIISTAPEGYTVIQANILGLTEIGVAGGKLAQSDYIFKELSLPRIVQFLASPSSGAPGQQVTLKWRVENAKKGILLPDGYDIMGAVPQQSGSRNVTLDKETDRYYLNLIGNNFGVFKEANVFLTPPVISALYIDDYKNICWETHFASHVLLAQQKQDTAGQALPGQKEMQFQEVDAAGTLSLEGHTTQVTLRCEGLYQVERQMAIPPAADTLAICAEYRTYKNHCMANLMWKSVGMKEFMVVVGDGTSYILSTELKGSWEQSYPSTTRLVFLFNYTSADGRKEQIQLEKKGETV